MDALQVNFSNTLLGRLYLLGIYAIATFVVVQRLANMAVVTALSVLLLVLFYREWRRIFSVTEHYVQGIRYLPQASFCSNQSKWSLKRADEWQSVNELKCYYQVPWLMAVKVVESSSQQSRVAIIWRDSMTAQEWRSLRIYLAL
ncbi:hypothetical protein N9W57_06185 [Pseudomonadales bacterium]|nr:hypothetical protein [Pseudomonadales bacterium]